MTTNTKIAIALFGLSAGSLIAGIVTKDPVLSINCAVMSGLALMVRSVPTLPDELETPDEAKPTIIEAYSCDNPEGIAAIQRLIQWQTVTIQHAIVAARCQHDPDASIEDIVQDAFTIGAGIRRRCIGNRTTVTAADQFQIIEATIRYCAEQLGIVEAENVDAV